MMSILRLSSVMPSEPNLVAEMQRAQSALNRALSDAKLPPLTEEQAVVFQQLAICSPFITQVLRRYPNYCSELLDIKRVQQPLLSADYQAAVQASIAVDTDIVDAVWMRQLREVRQREMVRIAICDLLGLVPFATVLQSLSKLADAYLHNCHDWVFQKLSEKYGLPIDSDGLVQSLLILGMGKLGGEELNYSSDIDLIFFYPQSGMTQPQKEGQVATENQLFFTQLGQRIIRLLNDVTEDGFVFRVDMRLRPNGDSGPLVMNFSAMEIYYQSQGRDWERYAFVKARAITGSPEHIHQFTTTLKPFIYRRYLDYGAFAALREMKGNIMREVTRRGMRDNIKLGSGGIREIEFIGQTFQLIRGGREPVLQERSILPILNLLAGKGVLENVRVQQLKEAYVFLRRAENRLQIVADLQTHQLPSDEIGKARLAYAMGYGDWQGFKAVLDEHQNNVDQCFADVFSFDGEEEEKSGDDQFRQIWQNERSEEVLLRYLRQSGLQEPKVFFDEIEKLRSSYAVRQMSKTARERLDRLMPLLLQMLVENTLSIGAVNSTFTRLASFVQAVARRSVYFALISEYPSVLKQLIEFFAASSWLAEYLTRHPVLLDTLIDVRLQYSLPDKARLRERLQEIKAATTVDNIEHTMDALRDFKNEIVLRVAAVDINKELPLMKVSDRLTELAEAMLETVHQIAWQQLVEKHGLPACLENGRMRQPELGIVGYGKLGGIELAYGSDLDVVFLNNSAGEAQRTQGKIELDNDAFFMRMTQRIMHMLGTQTGAGQLYEPDVRLRPDGVAGLMVSSLAAFERYQLQKAWVWEHQALVRARIIVGSEAFQAEFESIRHRVLTQQRDIGKLRQEVLQMREKMRKELSKSKPDEFDIKHDAGGIVDIEFMVQYGVLAWAQQFPDLTRYTDNIRILEYLAEFGILTADNVVKLIEAYRHLREHGHRLTLLGMPTIVKEAAKLSIERENVKSVWQSFMLGSVKTK